MKRRDFLSSLPAGVLLFSLASMRANADEQITEHPTLRFHDGKFRILHLTDLHFKYDDHSTNLQDSPKTLALMATLIEQENPDFIIVTGDLTSDRANTLPHGIADTYERFTSVFSDHKVPFAVTFGNHDNDRHETTTEQMEFLRRNPFNLTRTDDESLPGAGNCVLSVLGESDDAPRWNFWLFDSHQYTPNRDGMDWIKFSQIEWYRRRSGEFTQAAGHPVPGLAFCHIPIPEFQELYQTGNYVGSEEQIPGGSPYLNSGLFTSFVEMGDVRGMFCGHNHDCDYVGELHGITLGFGRKIGFSSGGIYPHGGRVIDLEEGGGFSTRLIEPGKRMFEYVSEPKEN